MSNDPCPFCDIAPHDRVLSCPLAYARWDRYPASPGHLLIIPVRHVASYFELTPEERVAVWGLVEEARVLLDRTHHPDGYNIGVNVGVAAGQTVMHMHLHVMPRYVGDTPNPRGGVRGAVPGKREY